MLPHLSGSSTSGLVDDSAARLCMVKETGTMGGLEKRVEDLYVEAPAVVAT